MYLPSKFNTKKAFLITPSPQIPCHACSGIDRLCVLPQYLIAMKQVFLILSQLFQSIFIDTQNKLFLNLKF